MKAGNTGDRGELCLKDNWKVIIRYITRQANSNWSLDYNNNTIQGQVKKYYITGQLDGGR